MEIFDIVVLLFIGYGLIKGFSKGFIIEVSGFLALFAGIYVAFLFSDLLSEQLKSYVDWNTKTIQIASFFILFVGCVYLVSLFAKMLTNVLKLAALGFLNRLLGACFGVLKMTLIASTLLMAYVKASNLITLFPNTFLEGTVTFDPLLKIGTYLFDWAMENGTKIPDEVIIV